MLPCADTDGISKFGNEDFAIAEVACAQNSLSSIEHLVNWDFTDDGLYFYLRDKVDIIFLATIYFLMPLLQTAAEHLADGHAQHTDFIEGFHQVIEFAGTGNDFDFGYFHSTPQPFFAACMTVLASISLEFSKAPIIGLPVSTERE